MTSARWRYFSSVRMTLTETMLSLRSRSSRARRRSMSCRSVGVMSTWRPVMSSRISVSFRLPSVRLPALRSAGSWQLAAGSFLEKHLPLIGCRDLELLAIFGDGAPGEHQPFLLQNADDLRIAERLAWV